MCPFEPPKEQSNYQHNSHHNFNFSPSKESKKKMPRASSRSSSSRSAPARSAPPPPARSAPAPTPPPPRAQPPAPAPAPPASLAPAPQQSGGIMSGLAATVMQGMAFGTGSAIAHRAVGAVAGAMSGDSSEKSVQQTPQAPAYQAPVQQSAYQGACSVDLTAFNNCMRDNNNNVTACDFYYQALQQCQASNSSY
jgi:hypothetical protein